MFMDGNSNETRNELIFSHKGNARAAASVILVGMIAALVGGVFMAIGPKVKPTSRQTVDSAVGATSNPVRIVGQAPHDQVPHDNVPCDQQVWPNIEQHCLVRKEAAPKPENIASTARTGDLPPPPPAPPSAQGAVSTAAPPSSVPPVTRQRESLDLADSSSDAVTPFYEDADELRQQEYMEPPPRKRQRRNYRPFHFHFGAFRF
jgi:hypothetical protein